MKNYYMCDIHFHTCNSFDGFAKQDFDIDKIAMILKGKNVTDDVRLVCFTDHNYFNYLDFQTNFSKLKDKGILCLPGIEINTTERVHWVIIFNNEELNESIKNDKKGEILEKRINGFYKYNTSIDILKQAANKQLSPVPIEDFVDLLNEIGIEYIAIPHFDKNNGGWYNQLKKDPEQLQLLESFIKDNIIFGLESKQIKENIKKNMKLTQEHIDEYTKLFDELDSSDDEKRDNASKEINKRKDHLKKLYKINDCIEMTSVIYGSDYHGHGTYDKSNLFIMKSELSFEGLKFALLDSESRVFSISKYKKCLKSENYVIDNVIINENNVEKTIQFGDGLNCIIGSRGSGKTYFLSMLLGETKKYSTINKSISLKTINFQNKSAKNKLSNEMYDYVAQKNTIDKDYFAKKTSIYDLLARAPYDYEEFERQLKVNFSKQPETKKEVTLLFDKTNSLIKKYDEMLKVKNEKLDLSFIDAYNDYFNNKSDSIEVYEIFNSFNQYLSTASTDKIKQLNIYEDFKHSYDDYISKIKIVMKFNEVKKYISEKEMEDYIEVSKEIYDAIYVNAKKLTITNQNAINIVKNRANSIVQRLKNEASNSHRILTDSMSILNNYISSLANSLREIKKEYNEIADYNKSFLVNEDVYNFSQGDNTLSVRVEKKFFPGKVDEKQKKEIFESYNSFNISNALSLLAFQQDYGKFYEETLVKNRDQRRTNYSLKEPTISPTIYLSTDGKVERNWIDLSPGQRSDMLLNIILLNDSNKILIIDQPEDDLDNETIFKKIVKRLQELKLRRQIIIVTHNANLAITADCDYFVICQSVNDSKYSIINDTMESKTKYKYHSINNSETNEHTALEIATEILDGGKEALKKRVRKIGYRGLFFE